MTATRGPERPLRRLGYRLLGPSFDYVLHLRPAEWPIMAGHTALGLFLATGLPGVLAHPRLGDGVLGLALWVVALNGGTLAINSAFDRDEGDVAYLRNPPPPPRRSSGLITPTARFTPRAGLRHPRAIRGRFI